MAPGQNRPPVASQTFPESFPRQAQNAAPFTRTPRVPPPAHSRPQPAIATQPLTPVADKGERARSATERFGRAVPAYGSRSAPNHHIRPRHAPYRAALRSINAAATAGLSEGSKAKRPLTNLPALQPENPPHRVLIKPREMGGHPAAERQRRLNQHLYRFGKPGTRLESRLDRPAFRRAAWHREPAAPRNREAKSSPDGHAFPLSPRRIVSITCHPRPTGNGTFSHNAAHPPLRHPFPPLLDLALTPRPMPRRLLHWAFSRPRSAFAAPLNCSGRPIVGPASATAALP